MKRQVRVVHRGLSGCIHDDRVQAVGSALLLINPYVPLALTILGQVIVNILLYNLLLNHEGIGGALIVAVFWFPQRLRLRRYSERLWVCADVRR